MLALLVVVGGCGGDETTPTPQPPTCGEHELALPDGSCIRPGIPPGGCAEGFEHDGMAVPGQAECRPVMPCGEGKWGDLPIDGTTQHVDGSYAGGDSDGSADRPWTTISAAYDAAAAGALIAVAAGTYGDVVIWGKPVRLWGVCPDQVAIVGTGAELGAVTIGSSSNGAEVGGLSLRGTALGLALSGSEGVVVDRVRVHDNAQRGVTVEDTLGPTSLELRDSLVENNHDYGLFASGSSIRVVDSVVRATQPRPSDQALGRGINVQLACYDTTTGQECHPDRRSNGQVLGSLVERNHEHGVIIVGSDGLVEASVIRATLPRASDLFLGVGVSVQPSCVASATGQVCDPATRSTATIRGSLVDQNHETGLYAMGADVIVETTVVRATAPRPADQTTGRGIHISPVCWTTATGLQCDPTTPANVVVRQALVDLNHDHAILVLGSQVEIVDSVARDTLPRAWDQAGGRGVVLQPSTVVTPDGVVVDPSAPSVATLRRSLVTGSPETGLVIFGSQASVEASVVRATTGNNSQYGDGIIVCGRAGLSAAATFWNVHIEDSTRAGLANFGASVSLGQSTLVCSAFDLEGGTHMGASHHFDDLGGNRCGCPAADGPCLLESVGLEPPEMVAPVQ